MGFDAVAQGQARAGVDGVDVVERVAEFVDRGGVPWRGQRVEADVQGVAVGDDVAGAGQGGADQGVGFVVGAGVAGGGEDRTRQRLGAVLNAAIRMAWWISLVSVSRTCWPGWTWASGSRAGIAWCAASARRVPAWRCARRR